MDTRWVDFHLHSHCSDGTDAPETVVERAAALGMSALALTDHDSLLGVDAGRAVAALHGLVFLNGVELSAEFGGHEVHVLGLGVRTEFEPLRRALESLAEGRANRAEAIISRLNQLGVPITRERVFARAGGGAVGRMHVAQEVQSIGFSTTVQGAFDRYIKAGRPAFVKKPLISMADALEVIHGAKGLAFVAHPGLSRDRGRLERMLAGYPFDGIEAWHSKHSPGQTQAYLELARTQGLLVTGGSDCHGTAKGDGPAMGSVRVPWWVWERMQERLASAV